MPYCTNCGEEVTDEQRYCSYCGEPVGDGSKRSGGKRGGPRERQRTPRGPENEPNRPGSENEPDRRGPKSESDPRGHEGSTGTAESAGFEGDPPPEGYEDPPGVGTTQRTRPSLPGVLDLFGGSLRTLFGFPLLLAGLFLGWLGFFLVYFFLPAALPLAAVLAGLFGLFVAGMIHVGTEDSRTGDQSSVGRQARRVSGSFLALAGVWILFMPPFLVGVGFLLLPGLLVGCRLFLAFPAAVLDGEGVFDSFSTSWDLTKGIGLKTFGLLFLASLAVIVLVIVLSIFTTAIAAAAGADLPTEAGSSPAEAAEQLDLAEYPGLIAAASVSYSISLALVVGAVQVAAARLYLMLRYGGPDSTPR